eukprot:scpid91801/ scgid34872/ 
MEDCGQQEHALFTHNFYTSEKLTTSLLQRNCHLVGTIRSNRRGFPEQMKRDMKAFERHDDRGSIRYVQAGQILHEQQKDKCVASMVSTAHTGQDSVLVRQQGKDATGHHIELHVPQCVSVSDYSTS